MTCQALPEGYRVEEYASGLRRPVAMAFAPDGRLFVTEQHTGNIRLVVDGELLPQPFATVERLFVSHEAGLLGIAIDPDFEENHYVYVFYNAIEFFPREHFNKVVRFTEVDGIGTDPLEILPDLPGIRREIHTAGNIHFGPDGKLYISLGELERPDEVQELSLLPGKILRVNPDGSAPEDNPFFGEPDADPRIYAYGLRNAFDFDFHPETGMMFATENGPSTDEINRIVPGGNYGWPDVIGPSDDPDFIDPFIYYERPIGPAGASFYSGDRLAEYKNNFFFCQFHGGGLLHRVQLSDDGTAVILDRTPCYTEAGGQIDDVGRITGGDGFVFEVARMEKVDRAIVHHGRTVTGNAAEWKDREVRVAIDSPRRRMIQRNHTATHLLHKALRTVLGDHAQQAGSLVAPDRLRFDFSHTGPMTPEQIEEVAKIVNREILANTPVQTDLTDYKAAIADGVTALFGEKYEDEVRVVKIGDYSSELCGGTHVRSTGEIGLFRITTETGVAAGVRRIEAITGEEAVAQAAADARTVQRAAGMLKTSPDKVLDRMESTTEEVRNLRSELALLRKKLAAGDAQAIPSEMLADVGIRLIHHRLPDGTAADAAAIADQAKSRTEATVALVAAGSGHVVLSVSAAATGRGISAGDLLKVVTQIMGGGGGGRADFAKGKVASLDKWDESKTLLIAKLRGADPA
ncbi:MAG: PQQ-dependent sugar dehydrogenase [Acidobacteria bacterium]|nr:PQQ-dependent sugar dehydrogenase [Acidobacteriota bacterium]